MASSSVERFSDKEEVDGSTPSSPTSIYVFNYLIISAIILVCGKDMSKKVTREEIEKFVKENLVTANDRRMACGDGRYMPEQSEGAIRAFGADFGMIMAFAGALNYEGTNIDPEEIVERYSRAKKKEFGQDVGIYYHCDSHNHEEGKIGCGHIAKASDPQNDGLYGNINHKEVKELFDAFTKHPESNLTVLDGQHEEKAVLFVHGAPDSHEIPYSINSKDRKGNMYFVVDMDRINRFIDKIAPAFSAGLLIQVNPEDVKRNYAVQMGTTAKLLNADKLDHYKIALDQRGHFIMEQLPKPRQEHLDP